MRDCSDKVFNSRERLHGNASFKFSLCFLAIYKVFSSLQLGIAFNITYKD